MAQAGSSTCHHEAPSRAATRAGRGRPRTGPTMSAQCAKTAPSIGRARAAQAARRPGRATSLSGRGPDRVDDGPRAPRRRRSSRRRLTSRPARRATRTTRSGGAPGAGAPAVVSTAWPGGQVRDERRGRGRGRARRTRRRAAAPARCRRSRSPRGGRRGAGPAPSDRCSPWDAWVRAGRPPTTRSSSSRCGPTRLTPRRSSSARRPPASAAAEPGGAPWRVVARRSTVGRRDRRTCGVRLAPAPARSRSSEVARAPRRAPRPPRRAWRPTRRAWSSTSAAARRPPACLQQRVALAQDPVEVGPQRRRCAGASATSDVVEVARGARPGRPSPARGRRARTP